MKKTLFALLTAALILSLTMSAFAATGLGSYTKVTAKPAADANGSVGADTTMCAVTLDEEGRIVGVVFDVVQASAAFDATGAVAGEVNAEPQTKNELGEAYGMKKASPIGKEFSEQMDALAAWCVGKTLDQVLAVYAEDADLKAGCTVYIGTEMMALQKAIANAK